MAPRAGWGHDRQVRWIVVVATLTSLSIAGCGDSSDTSDETTYEQEALFELGDYDVGFVETQLTYTEVATGEPRTLDLRIWYPAQTDGEPTAIYSLAGAIEVPTGVARVEPAVAEGGPFPLAVYSHGNGADGLLAYPYGELFASHGWVVAAPNHTGNTALEALAGEGDPFARVALNRPHDITAAIDELESGLSGQPLEGRVATDAVFMFGHSFGAFTTLAVGGADLDVQAFTDACEDEDCEVLAEPETVAAFEAGFGDPRVVALGPQAPALAAFWKDGELAGIPVPTLLITSDRDELTPFEEEAQPAWSGLDDEDDLWVRIPEGGHYTFITICDDLTEGLLLAFRPNALNDGCGDDFIPVSIAVPPQAAYLLGFARLHVLGESGWASILRDEVFEESFVVSTH